MSTDNLYKKIVDDTAAHLDVTCPIIEVKAFKKSGKWYSSKFSYLTEDHINIINSAQGWEIEDMIRYNHKDVHEYSPLNGFPSGMIYVIDVYNCTGFLMRLIER